MGVERRIGKVLVVDGVFRTGKTGVERGGGGKTRPEVRTKFLLCAAERRETLLSLQAVYSNTTGNSS